MYGRFAGIYDALMSDVDRDGWANYILSLLPDGEGLRIADVACGTGALTLPLARAGHRLTGIDISREMLAVASEKARLERLDIPFVCQSMTKLALHRRVDAIVCACDGVNYLCGRGESCAFFASARENLRPGGLLLFDVSSRYKLSSVLGNNTFTSDGEEAAYIWRNEYDEETKLIRMELTFFERGGDGRYERFCETHVQRAHSRRELENALARAGFRDIKVYGAFTKLAPEETCERLQFAATAPERE